MVTVRKDHPISADGTVDIDLWMAQFANTVDDGSRATYGM